MELPEDVLQLVREFSKPCFPHYKEYKLALRLLGVESCPRLKQMLTFHTEIIIPFILVYEKARLDYEIARDQYNIYYHLIGGWAVGSIRNNYLMKKQDLKNAHHTFLENLFPFYPMSPRPRDYPVRLYNENLVMKIGSEN